MSLYTRHILRKLWLLRLLLVIIVLFVLFLFRQHKGDYGFVLAFIALLCSVFPLTQLTISENAISVRQYFFYGFLYRTLTFEKMEGTIEVQPLEMEFSDGGYLNTDEWWDIFFVFSPISTLRVSKYLLKQTDAFENAKSVKLKLTGSELSKIKEFILSS